MKKATMLALLALCLFCFANCGDKPEGSDSRAIAKRPDAPADAMHLPADLDGYWVNNGWWQELKSSKSPRMAAARLNGISSAIFRPDGKGGHIADLGFGWHEGMQYAVRQREGRHELYDPNNAATGKVALAPQPDGSLHLDSTAMVRLADGFNGAHVIAHDVLGGTYNLGGKPVVFNPDGTVMGLEGFGYYNLLLDYVVDDLGTDQLSLSKDGSNPQYFAFKMEGNKLTISQIDDVGGKDEFNYKVGKARYVLTKE